MKDEARKCPACGGRSRRGGVCRSCIDLTRGRLGELTGWWDALQDAVIRRTRLQPVSGTAASGDQWRWPYDIRASYAARDIAATIAQWVRLTVSLGATTPPRGTRAQIEHLVSWHDALAKHSSYLELMADLYRIIGRIMRVVDHPDVAITFEVGPCYVEVIDEDGATSICTGTLTSYIPRGGGELDWAPFIGCSEHDDHWWDAPRFRRAGEWINRRRAELERARKLAQEIGDRP